MSNVGYATLSIIPSAKGFLRKLQAETKSPLEAYSKEVGKALSDQVANAVGEGLSKANAQAFGQRVGDSTRSSTSQGIRDGVKDGAKVSKNPLRISIGKALRGGFSSGFKFFRSSAQT